VTDAHGDPTPEVPLADPDVRAPSHAERARTLVSRQATGTLATLDPDGFPHGSYVTYTLDGADPVFLISKLATHTQHLARDPRSSLMAHETGADDPLAADAEGILRHMNDDHGEALRLYAKAFTRATDAERAVMTGIDRYGFEMSVDTPTARPSPARAIVQVPLPATDRPGAARRDGERQASLHAQEALARRHGRPRPRAARSARQGLRAHPAAEVSHGALPRRAQLACEGARGGRAPR